MAGLVQKWVRGGCAGVACGVAGGLAFGAGGGVPRGVQSEHACGGFSIEDQGLPLAQRRFIIEPMNPGPRDVAQIRLANALALFDEFVHANVKHADAATLRGLEGRFAEKLQIQASYWSQIKGRSRQIGERLARQFEQLCHKPAGWMDDPHGHAPSWAAAGRSTARASAVSAMPVPVPVAVPAPAPPDDAQRNVPQDDDERFIVGLVLTYYRRHPQRARTRLLDLLGEVLVPQTSARAKPAPAGDARAPDDGRELWSKTQAAVAPLKRKR